MCNLIFYGEEVMKTITSQGLDIWDLCQRWGEKKGDIWELDNSEYLIKMSSFYYNDGHNIMRIFDVFPNFPFTTSETKPDY